MKRLFSKTLHLPDESEPAGNAFCIMGFINDVMEDAFEATNGNDERFNQSARDTYFKDATSGNYYHLRSVSQKVLDIVNNYDRAIV